MTKTNHTPEVSGKSYRITDRGKCANMIIEMQKAKWIVSTNAIYETLLGYEIDIGPFVKNVLSRLKRGNNDKD